MNILLILVGCMTYESAIKTSCAIPTLAPECLELPTNYQMICLSEALGDSVKNPKAIGFLTEMGSQPEGNRGNMLREESASLGLPSCELADLSDELNKQAETDSIQPEESQKPSQTKEALVEPPLAPADGTELPDTVTE